MKKWLFISIASSMLSVNCFANNVLNTTSSKEVPIIQQSSNWELIGDVIGVAADGRTLRGKLYVKVIGQREFYKVRCNYSSGGYDEYNVGFGKFVINNKQYNAKFDVPDFSSRITYYLNL